MLPKYQSTMLRSCPNINKVSFVSFDGDRASCRQRNILLRASRGLPREPFSILWEMDNYLYKNCTNDDAVALATNGPLPPAPVRSSPASQGMPIANGKPTSPFSERQQLPGSPNAQIAAQTVSSKDPKLAAQQASDMRNVVRRKLTGYVGFANLPNQWHRKSVRKGFNFNVMVVGKELVLLLYWRYIDLQLQVNLVSESLPWSTPSSTPHYTRRRSEKDRASILCRKRSQFNQ